MAFLKCLECGEILQSKYTHDFVRCSCPNQTFLDGGDEYGRYGGIDMDKIQIIDSTNVYSVIERYYPTYDPHVDDRPITEVLDEIHEKLRKYT